MDKIIRLNKFAAIAHLLSFGALLGFYYLYANSHTHARAYLYRSALPKVEDLSTTCNTEGKAIDQSVGKCFTTPVQGVPIRTKVSFNLVFGAATFFAITAFAHYFYASDGFKSGVYTTALKQGWNPYRWIEYGISASLMSILIGYVLGVNDISQLANFALITAGMQASGYVVEAALKQPIINRSVVIGATVGGWLLFTALWGPLIYTFWSRVNDIKLNYGGLTDGETGKPLKIPNWVWFIVLVQLYNYMSFGIIQARQISKALKGTPMLFTDVEAKYLKLSFAGKLGLASGIGYGLIFRTRDCAIPTKNLTLDLSSYTSLSNSTGSIDIDNFTESYGGSIDFQDTTLYSKMKITLTGLDLTGTSSGPLTYIRVKFIVTDEPLVIDGTRKLNSTVITMPTPTDTRFYDLGSLNITTGDVVLEFTFDLDAKYAPIQINHIVVGND